MYPRRRTNERLIYYFLCDLCNVAYMHKIWKIFVTTEASNNLVGIIDIAIDISFMIFICSNLCHKSQMTLKFFHVFEWQSKIIFDIHGPSFTFGELCKARFCIHFTLLECKQQIIIDHNINPIQSLLNSVDQIFVLEIYSRKLHERIFSQVGIINLIIRLRENEYPGYHVFFMFSITLKIRR